MKQLIKILKTQRKTLKVQKKQWKSLKKWKKLLEGTSAVFYGLPTNKFKDLN